MGNATTLNVTSDARAKAVDNLAKDKEGKQTETQRTEAYIMSKGVLRARLLQRSIWVHRAWIAGGR